MRYALSILGCAGSRCMHVAAATVLLSGLWLLPASPTLAAAGSDVSASLVFGGLTRTYLIHLPAAYVPSHQWPLMVLFHGRLGTGKGTVTLTHMDSVADRYGFIVVYPDGYRHSWADGRGSSPADLAGVDDVGFTLALLDKLAASYAIDRSAVGAAGISNGGFMVQRLACVHPERFAVVAAVAATFPAMVAARCRPSRPIPILYIHGTSDPLVPYTGGAVDSDLTATLSSDDSTARWVQLNRCTGKPAMASIPDRADDGTSVRSVTFTNCAGGVVVTRYTIVGGGHTWPGGLQYLPASVVGKTTHNLDASRTIWRFLHAHSHRP